MEPAGFHLEAEYDKTTAKDNLVGGRRLIRLTNVTTPQLTRSIRLRRRTPAPA